MGKDGGVIRRAKRNDKGLGRSRRRDALALRVLTFGLAEAEGEVSIGSVPYVLGGQGRRDIRLNEVKP